MSQYKTTEGPPSPGQEKPKAMFFDRLLPVFNFLLLLGGLVWSGYIYFNFTRYEQAQRKAEILAGGKPHVKPQFSIKVSKVSAPTKNKPGVYAVEYSGKIANSGKLPFQLGKTSLVSYLGLAPDLMLHEPKVFNVNPPELGGQFQWKKHDEFGIGPPFEGSILNPGEEASLGEYFFVVAPEGAFVAIQCGVKLNYVGAADEKTDLGWSNLSIADLREAKWQSEPPSERTEK